MVRKILDLLNKKYLSTWSNTKKCKRNLWRLPKSKSKSFENFPKFQIINGVYSTKWHTLLIYLQTFREAEFYCWEIWERDTGCRPVFLMACMGGDTSNSVSTCTCRFKKRAVALLHSKTKRTFGSQVNTLQIFTQWKLWGLGIAGSLLGKPALSMEKGCKNFGETPW